MLKYDRKSLLAAGLAGLVFAAGSSAHRPDSGLQHPPGWLAKQMRDTAAAKRASRAQMPPRVQVRKDNDKGLEIGQRVGARRVGMPTGRYFVRLEEPAVVEHLRGRGGLDPHAPLDLNGSNAAMHEARLRQQQSQTLQSVSATLGRSIVPRMSFTKALNGFSIEISDAEAERIAALPGVARVQPVLAQPLDTDVGPGLIGAPAIWDGSATGTATLGEGVTVGIIDTGINSNHPSFAATTGAFTHTNPLGTGTFLGYCATNAGFCNDKLIGAYDFVFDLVDGEADVTEEASPEDNNSHGSHTASTVAGNPIEVDFLSSVELPISGVAPHANIIAYDACYTITSTGQGQCPQDATAASVEQAIEDGVDVINFSIGGGDDPYNDFVSEAFLAATDAGIYIAASAGNDGPEPETLGHQEPWTSTTAATTHNRDFTAGVSVTGPTTPPELQNIAYVQGSGLDVSTDIVDDIASATVIDAANETACAAFAAGAFTGKIALVLRGGCDFVVKVRNAQAAGATAVIVRNQNPGAPIIQGGLDVPDITIPSVMIRRDIGQDLSDYIAANPTATVRIDADETRQTNAQADVVADFSSRGPNTALDVLKPDLAAPGVNILAAVADGFGDVAGTEVNLLSGTSMASPHNAGSAALLRALRPTWSPMEIKSALMLTAKTADLVKENESTPADPLDVGNGRVQVALAANAGLVMDETTENFEDANPAEGGDPRSLNLASLYSSNCIATANCSFERTFTNPTSGSVTWNIAIAEPADVTMTATPSSFTLAPGASQTVLFEADATDRDPADGFGFGTVTLSDDADVLGDLHMNVAIQASAGDVPETVTINTRRDAGSQAVTGLITPPATDLTFIPSGLMRGTTVTGEIPEDSDNGDVFDDPTDGTFFQLVQPDAFGMRFVAEIIAAEASDFDLYLGIDANGDGQPQEDELIAVSATAAALERAEVRFLPPGFDYWILIQNWEGSASAPDAFTLSYAYVPYEDPQNLAVTAPQAPAAGVPYDIRVFFDEPAMAENERWYGALDVGGDFDGALAGAFGTIGVDVVRHEDDVVKTASVATAMPGDTVSYTLTVRPNVTPEDLVYAIEDAVPAGMQIVPGSVQASAGTANVNGQDITWDLTMGLPGFDYTMTDSANDAACAMPFSDQDGVDDPYIDWQPVLSGNPAPTALPHEGPFSFNLASLGGGIPYYQNSVVSPTLFFNGNGVLSFDIDSIFSDPAATGANVAIPDADLPNSLLALLWADLSFTTVGAGTGYTSVNLSAGGVPVARVIEFDNLVVGGNPANTIDAEIYLDSRIIDGAPEIMFAYANPTGAFTTLTNGTIGLENADGSRGVQYAYNDAALQFPAATAICFDLVQFGSSETLTFDAVVQASAANSVVVNTALHDTDNPGSLQAAATASVVVNATDLSITKTDGVQTLGALDTTTYSIVVSNLGTNDAIGATVTDNIPAPLICEWTCVGANGGTCTASGTGNISDTVTIAAGGSLTYTATCDLNDFAGVTLVNTATVSHVTDINAENDSASDTNIVIPSETLIFRDGFED